MGYTTDFSGHFEITPALTQAQVEYLQAFNYTRRMKRDATKLADVPDPKRIAVGLPLGIDAEYFVGYENDHGQDHDISIVSYNGPPAEQPGLWCQWEVESTILQWDGGEKFYDYVEWLQY